MFKLLDKRMRQLEELEELAQELRNKHFIEHIKKVTAQPKCKHGANRCKECKMP